MRYCLGIPIVVSKRLRATPDIISVYTEVEDVVTRELPVRPGIPEL